MCEQCLAKTVLYLGPKKKEVLPGYSLVRATIDGNYMKKDEWGLVRCNDPDVIWSVTPVVDPDDGLSDDQIGRIENSKEYQKQCLVFDKAFVNLEKALNRMNFDYAIWLGVAMKKSGYNPKKHGYRSSCWLCHHIAKFLKTAHIEK